MSGMICLAPLLDGATTAQLETLFLVTRLSCRRGSVLAQGVGHTGWLGDVYKQLSMVRGVTVHSVPAMHAVVIRSANVLVGCVRSERRSGSDVWAELTMAKMRGAKTYAILPSGLWLEP
jgi:hypothetical protein